MADGCPNTFRLSPLLSVVKGNVSENYQKWKRQVQVYLTASGTIILICADSLISTFTNNLYGMKRNPRTCLKP